MKLGPGIAKTPLPKGFFAGGVNSGVRKYRPDVGLIVSDFDMTAAGVFTQNEAKAAPVLWSQRLVPSNKIRAIITNSGQANAATGELGRKNNYEMVRATASVVGCEPEEVLVASTGMIGVHLNVELINKCLPELYDRVTDNAEHFANAILTTDLVPKTISTKVTLSTGEITITGIAKGSGMIHPNMATMLGYILTDAKLEAQEAHTYLKNAVDKSFNMVSVDGDTSTNDCAFLLANGATGVEVKTTEDKVLFQNTVTELSQLLAQAIARDGEGATKLIEVNLHGGTDLMLARKAARGLIVSPLFKCAIHGEDPNWGRILARLGAEGIPSAELDKMTLKLQGEEIFTDGAPIVFDRDKVRGLLRTDTVLVEIIFPNNNGVEMVKAWGCDFSKKYVDINAEYN
jgi:glutamate N-acetyltransferase / amino-acid N-acetyltransferase